MRSNFHVIITESARRDIAAIWKYIAENDSAAQADEIYEVLKVEIRKLRHYPHKGHLVPELERIDIYDYLGVRHKPYRIIYRITSGQVAVYAVIDGRRDLMTTLSKRIFRS